MNMEVLKNLAIILKNIITQNKIFLNEIKIKAYSYYIMRKRMMTL